MPQFRKLKDCPSTFDLADAAIGEVEGWQGLRLATHLATCDFCAAELEFYRAYPIDNTDGLLNVEIATMEEAVNVADCVPPIPPALRELAEALIAKETIHISRLEHLLRDAS